MPQRSLLTSSWEWIKRRRAELVLAPCFLVSLFFPPRQQTGLGPLHWLWLAALLAVFFSTLLRAKRGGGPVVSAVAAAALLLLLNAGVVYGGGVSSPLWPGYFLFLLAASSVFYLWWQQFAFLAAIAVLEAVQALRPGKGTGVGEDPIALAAGLLLLAVFALLLHVLFLKRYRSLQEDLKEHSRLQEEAENFSRLEELRAEPGLEAHTPRGKMVRRMSVAEKLNRDIERLLELTRRALGARTVVLFESDGSRLAFRSAAEGSAKVDRRAGCRIGEGVIGGVAKLGRHVMMSSFSQDRRRLNYLLEGDPALSLMVVPVKEQEVLRGVLVADHEKAGKFSRGELEVFECFALEVNLLLENFRESSLRDRRKMTLETLNALSNSLSMTLEADKMLESLVDGINVVIPYDQCAVFFVDPERRRLVLQTQRGFRFESPSAVSFPLKKNCLVSYIVNHGQPLVFSDRKKMEIIPGYTGLEKMRSFLGLPLRFRDELEGTIIFASAKAAHFTHYHLETLQLLANQAAAQISNAILHRQVEKMALTDGLTGLYNHRHFQERLDHELQRAERHNQHLSLLLLDIDHFKKLNDTCGHPFGDVVLKEVSRQLAGIARSIDFVARYGGEEFAIILPGTARRGCGNMAERVLKSIRALTFEHEHKTLSVTISIGSSVFPEDGEGKEDLVRHADQALYLAKESGRNRHRTFKDVIRT
jgi:diguanylate cyclase (GGDEF)-like protein